MGRQMRLSNANEARTVFPSAEPEPERYRGRPLLVVLENYVLAAISELAPDKAASVGRLVQGVFGGSADWMATVRQCLELAPELDDELRRMWGDAQTRATEHGVTLHAIQFAKMVTDQNFAHLIEPLG